MYYNVAYVQNTKKDFYFNPSEVIAKEAAPYGAEPTDTNTITVIPKHDYILGVDPDYYRYMVDDNIITDYEKRILFDNYYTQSPKEFISTATLYGSEESSYVELSFYGEVIRQQMWRGFVLTGSGMYGHRYGEEADMMEFDQDIAIENFLLDNQASLAYLYYADRVRDYNNQPISVAYANLNERQKRIYDITEYKDFEIRDKFILPIGIMSSMNESDALASGRYIAFVSTKSPNDFGRRFLLYKQGKFVGVVLVTGTAKRSDWTGLELPTTETFRYYNNPLIVRRNNDVQWGFDFTEDIYRYFGGNGGPTSPILAIDPDM